MAYDQALDNRIRAIIDGWETVSTKKMFGGVCHLIAGNMFCGVYQDRLILRLGEARSATALNRPHVGPFDITGKPMKGWIMVDPQAVGTREALEEWLESAREFVRTLPPK